MTHAVGAERATLRSRDGATTAADARVRRYGTSRRVFSAVLTLLATTVLTLMSLPIPGLHFVAPWLLPLVGGGAAWFFFRREAVVDAVRGACPSCSAAIDVARPGTVGEEPLWLRCPGCRAPVELLVAGVVP